MWSRLKTQSYFTILQQIKRMSDAAENSSWCGAPISEMYGSHSPWGAPEFPLISPSYNHAVLFEICSERKEGPPVPRVGRDIWDSEHVRMPCSSHSLYPVLGENGRSTLKQRWNLIQEALQKPLRNSEDLASAILSYNTKFISIWKFGALHKLFNDYLEEEETQYFFNMTLPEIVKLALALPDLIPSSIPLLKRHKNRSVSLSQQQIACLLANAFFCTFPRRNTAKRNSEYSSFPCINFNMLYECVGSTSVLEKLKCICHYFRRVCTEVPVGVMTFKRHTVPPEKCPSWSDSIKFISSTPLHVDSEGIIEDAHGLIQVDFANKFLGGGVLRRGCVQEEIRFVICPELLISMLFTEVLDTTEALLMIGCERYSSYSGYGYTFQWSGNYQDTTPYDSSQRRRCAVLAIDAVPFSKKLLQYETKYIDRELNKAWVGVASYVCKDDDNRVVYPGVATGNWGCGAFGGNAHLKSLLQIMSCTEARRPVAYYTFNDIELKNDLIDMYNFLSKHNVTVGQLYKYIIQYKPSKEKKTVSDIHKFLKELIAPGDSMETSKSACAEVPWTSKSFSPDLFEEDDGDASDFNLLQKNVEVAPEPIEVNETIIKPVERKEKIEKLKQESIDYRRKPSLFDAMTEFDNESGKLNFSLSKSFVIEGNEPMNLSHRDDSSNTIAEENSEGSNLCDAQKRKLGKKITDYFNKNPT